MLNAGRSSEHSGSQGMYWELYFHTMIVCYIQDKVANTLVTKVCFENYNFTQ